MASFRTTPRRRSGACLLGVLAPEPPTEQTGGVGPDPELLDIGDMSRDPVPTRRWPTRPTRGWRAAMSVLLVVVVSLGWNLDHQMEARETTAITVCTDALQRASDLYEVRIWATYDYIEPSLGGSSRRRAELLGLMAEPARQVLPAAQNSTRRCEGIHILPWHSGNVARRNAVRAYATALELELREVATGQRTFDIADGHLARLRLAASISQASRPS